MSEIKPEDLNDALVMAHMEWRMSRTVESKARLDALREARRKLLEMNARREQMRAIDIALEAGTTKLPGGE